MSTSVRVFFLKYRLDRITPLLKILECLFFLGDEVKFIFHQDASKSGLSLGFQTCFLTTTSNMHSSSSNKSNFKVVSGNGGGDSVNINTKSIHPCRLQSRTVAQDFSFPGF